MSSLIRKSSSMRENYSELQIVISRGKLVILEFRLSTGLFSNESYSLKSIILMSLTSLDWVDHSLKQQWPHSGVPFNELFTTCLIFFSLCYLANLTK